MRVPFVVLAATHLLIFVAGYVLASRPPAPTEARGGTGSTAPPSPLDRDPRGPTVPPAPPPTPSGSEIAARRLRREASALDAELRACRAALAQRDDPEVPITPPSSPRTIFGTVEDVTGQARIPFRDDYPAEDQHADVFRAVSAILGAERIEAIDCTEYPCIVYADVTEETGRPTIEQTRALFEGLKAEGLAGGGLIVQRNPSSGTAALAVGTDEAMRIDDLAASIAIRQIRYFSASEEPPPAGAPPEP